MLKKKNVLKAGPKLAVTGEVSNIDYLITHSHHGRISQWLLELDRMKMLRTGKAWRSKGL